MSAIKSSADHLPHIDDTPSVESLTAAKSLIDSELSSADTSSLHPSLPPVKDFTFSEAIATEHSLLARSLPRETAIDLSRYEEPTAPTNNDKDEWHNALKSAYTASEYLQGKAQNLSLLETYGKNAWLVGNSQLEDVLRDLEKDVSAAKTGLENVQRERRAQQDAVRGEMATLEETWRTGVGRHIEVEAANERLRLQILERKRQSAA